ncbi:hypothetical protein HK405_012078 [Cladochytrium tenue]|nr:hypothetical protein HK405_012078 [Cladochytrium tenue]
MSPTSTSRLLLAAAAILLAAGPALALGRRTPADVAAALPVRSDLASSSSLAPLEPSGSSLLFGAWYDRPNGDTPLAINSRLQLNLSIFQTDIDLSGAVKPLTGPNITTQFLTHLEDTGTDAVAYLTVYPLAGWGNVTDEQISDLISRVTAIIDTGRSIFIRYAPEMNGNWFAYGMDPANFKSHWQSVYTSMKSALGTNSTKVAFVWSPNSGQGYPWPGGIAQPNVTANPSDQSRINIMDTNGNGVLDAGDDPYQPFYPGDDYVDWIYHYGSAWPWHDNVVPSDGEFESFLTGTYLGDTGKFPYYNMFSGSGCNVSTGNKPFIVSETGATYHYAWAPGADYGDLTLNTTVPRLPIKQAWWRQFLDPTFLSTYSRIKAICTFEFLKAEELTMRDFTSLGAPPNGFAEDNTVAAGFAADIASGQYGSNIVWASAMDSDSSAPAKQTVTTTATNGTKSLTASAASIRPAPLGLLVTSAAALAFLTTAFVMSVLESL